MLPINSWMSSLPLEQGWLSRRRSSKENRLTISLQLLAAFLLSENWGVACFVLSHFALLCTHWTSDPDPRTAPSVYTGPVCVCVCVYDTPRVSGPLELEIQVVMSHLAWVLGTELLLSSETAAGALNLWVISLAPCTLVFILTIPLQLQLKKCSSHLLS